jgi:ubiquinone/menaquinone biosynthesis C-methylase UbiE
MTGDLDAYREQSRATWGQMAPGWEDRREWFMEITARVNGWLVDAVGDQTGATVLELAAGTGDLGFLVAEGAGGEGRVISTDFAPEMVDVARRQGEARGAQGFEYRVLDAERMDLEDDSVDAVVCRWGYMLMADPAAALGETRRVLREGGPLAFAVWTTPDRNPWGTLPAMTLVKRGHMQPPAPRAPGLYSMGDEERLRELVTGAGFGDPDLEEITFDFAFADFDDVWDMLVRIAGPLAQVIRSLPEDEREATRAEIAESLAEYRGADGSYRAPASTWGVLAR